jgi:hypothetical protein
MKSAPHGRRDGVDEATPSKNPAEKILPPTREERTFKQDSNTF